MTELDLRPRKLGPKVFARCCTDDHPWSQRGEEVMGSEMVNRSVCEVSVSGKLVLCGFPQIFLFCLPVFFLLRYY